MTKPDRLRIMEIERFAIHDGPGIRTVVFLQGCPLHCPWCSNPESQKQGNYLFHYQNKCVGCGHCVQACTQGHIQLVEGYPRFDRQACVACRSCEEACPKNAIQFVGEWQTVEEILRVVMRDVDYYAHSGGGVTFSGGECFLQFEGLMRLLTACKQQGIHTAVETCGEVPLAHIQEAFPLVDLFLFDVKHTDPVRLRETTGAHWETVVGNLRYIAQQDPERVVIRVPVIPGFNDQEETLEAIFRLALAHHIPSVHLLPYHTLGKEKYERMGMTYPYPHDKMLSKEALLPYQKRGEEWGLHVQIGG